jgi:hypothetical protein
MSMRDIGQEIPEDVRGIKAHKAGKQKLCTNMVLCCELQRKILKSSPNVPRSIKFNTLLTPR